MVWELWVLVYLSRNGDAGQGFLALLLPETVLVELLLAVTWVGRWVAVGNVQKLPDNFNVVVLKHEKTFLINKFHWYTFLLVNCFSNVFYKQHKVVWCELDLLKPTGFALLCTQGLWVQYLPVPHTYCVECRQF